MKRKSPEKESRASRERFLQYLTDFYGPEGTYPDVLPNVTAEEVVTFMTWAKSPRARMPWGHGDSTDRERARDFILLSRGKSPRGYVLSADVFESGIQDILAHFEWRLVSPADRAMHELNARVLQALAATHMGALFAPDGITRASDHLITLWSAWRACRDLSNPELTENTRDALIKAIQDYQR
uniref:Uncharacterized protein n=1 Tax=viral metagenome TaxID=1070528 RepID=A0A6C0BP55_9ZZZZ